MKKLRVGVIGCGSIHKMHTTAAFMLDQSELVSVCDCIPERAQESGEYYSIPFYTDYQEMIANENLDVVHICTPHYLHHSMAQYALSQGVNVLSEKPMAITYEDAVDTVITAEKYNKKYGVIFQCRYNDASQFVKENLDSGALGRIISARAVLSWCRGKEYYLPSDWKGTLDKEGGGVLIDQAIHSIDLINWLVNSNVRRIDATFSNHLHDYIKVEDTIEGVLEFDNSATALFWFTTNYSIDEAVEIRLHCEKGTVRMTYDDAEIHFSNGQTISITQRNATVCDYLGGKQCWGLSHKVQIEQFYNSILSDNEPEISGHSALLTQRIVCGIYKSAREKHPVLFA